jgi:glycosyltransferase involved in cell wall biosynthesis
MRIALCHAALIPPPKYGGTERVIVWLARELVAMGHQVTLVALRGSGLPGVRTIPVTPGVDWEELVPGDVDLLHHWAPPGKAPRRPYLLTIEGNGRPGEVFLPNTVFVSRKHAENHGSSHFVYNGLPLDELECDEQRAGHFVFLAKASWKVKNLAGAIEVARAADVPLEVLGSRELPMGLQRWLPRFGGVRYHGMVGDAAKRKVLRNARGLLFPVRWHEPFGIALTEALGSGCPVFGTPYGSLPEIVTPDVGVLSEDPGVLVAALRRAKSQPWDPKVCRARVLRGMSSRDMALKYLGYYGRVLETGRIGDPGEPAPRTRDGFLAQALLPWGKA